MTIQRNPRVADHLGASLVDSLRAAIVRGEYSPNERLVEGDLARSFAVSRGAVRGALVELSLEGLVERELNRGARVRAITRDEAVEICEVRMALEGLLACRAAVRAGPGDVVALRSLVAAMEAAHAADDAVGYSQLNLALHRRVRVLADHGHAARLVEWVRNQSNRVQVALSLVPGRIGASLEEHRAIVEAIAAGDPEAAEAAMRDHLDHLAQVVRSLDASRIR